MRQTLKTTLTALLTGFLIATAPADAQELVEVDSASTFTAPVSGYFVPDPVLVDMQNDLARLDSLKEREGLLKKKVRALARDTTGKARRIAELKTLVARYDSLVDDAQEQGRPSVFDYFGVGSLTFTAGYFTNELAGGSR